VIGFRRGGEGRCKIEAGYEIGARSASVTGMPLPTPLAATARGGLSGSQTDLHGRPAVPRPMVAATSEGGCGGDEYGVGSRVSIGREDRICFWVWRRHPPSMVGVAWLPLTVGTSHYGCHFLVMVRGSGSQPRRRQACCVEGGCD
jgi:hypothetical protein